LAASLLCPIPVGATPAPAQAPLHLGVDYKFHPRIFEDGAYIGFPRDEAEQILDVFEVRLPILLKIIEGQDRLIDEQADQIRTATTGWAATASVAAMWRSSALAWQRTATTTMDSFETRRDMNEDPWVWWLILGMTAGVIGSKFILR
jgi:hypothetical protein